MVAALALPALAQQTPAPHFPSSEDLRHLKALSAPQLSPDGTQALFTVTDSTADGAKSHLWIVPIPAASGGPLEPRNSPPQSQRHPMC